jgi:hypothetical protein
VKRKDMKVNKVPIDPARIRTLPRDGFSWIDRRFVREGFIDRLPGEAILLYFFLTAVSDAQGLSFYADPTMGKLLRLDAESLSQSRSRLVAADLILYRYPIFQVLPLPEKPQAASRFLPPRPAVARGAEATSLAETLKLAVQRQESRERENP